MNCSKMRPSRSQGNEFYWWLLTSGTAIAQLALISDSCVPALGSRVSAKEFVRLIEGDTFQESCGVARLRAFSVSHHRLAANRDRTACTVPLFQRLLSEKTRHLSFKECADFSYQLGYFVEDSDAVFAVEVCFLFFTSLVLYMYYVWYSS